MWMPGGWELVLILLIVLIVFGAGKLPQVGRSLGSAINEFKESVKPKDDDDKGTKEA
jgi:sec-independent protein translocase protein TatA